MLTLKVCMDASGNKYFFMNKSARQMNWNEHSQQKDATMNKIVWRKSFSF